MRGEGRGGKALEGRDGEPALAACPCSARALARPTAACGAGAAAGAGGPLQRPRPWQGGGEPRAGGNWIPEDGVGDLQLGGTGNESGLLTGRLQTLGTGCLSEGCAINLPALFRGGGVVTFMSLATSALWGIQLVSVGSVSEPGLCIVLLKFLCILPKGERGKKHFRN